MSRWISMVRPLCFPLEASRWTREPVEPGIMPYSLVTQPPETPCVRIHEGTPCSKEAEQMTLVPPHSMRAEATGCARKSGVILIFRG